MHKIRRNSHCLKMLFFTLCSLLNLPVMAKQPAALTRFLEKEALRGASVALMVQEVKTGRTVYAYDVDRKLSPASVLKTVTTATALELLGDAYQFETKLMYDGRIIKDTLHGNIYIVGEGDPTINSSAVKQPEDSLIGVWCDAIKRAGIRYIAGTIIADDSHFDSEGVSMKWMREDLGSDYGQGSYGLNIFDNQYTLTLDTDSAGTQPHLRLLSPHIEGLTFHSYLTVGKVWKDSSYIIGTPFSNERWLYGALPSHRRGIKLKGDIPDPPLFFAQYLAQHLRIEKIGIQKSPTTSRLLSQTGGWHKRGDSLLIATRSPAIEEIAQITNFVSHNLYADVLIKTLGQLYTTEEDQVISSFDKGVHVVRNHWSKRGLEVDQISLFDGSGLALTNKVTARFLCELYRYMATKSVAADPFLRSLPVVGRDGTVRYFLRGTPLAGHARLKSGSMSRVRCYGGYITKGDEQYVIALMINDFSGESNRMKSAIEELLVALF